MTEFSEPPESGTSVETVYKLSPPWLRSDFRFQFSNAIVLDSVKERTRLGMLQRFPTLAQPGALRHLGEDRGIPRGLAEADESYAERLRISKTTWKTAGNAPGLLEQLWALTSPLSTRIRYVVNGYTGTPGAGTQFADWWTIDGTGLSWQRVSPTNWDWDGQYGKRARFWIIVYRSDLTVPVWGVPPYAWGASGLRWGAAPGSVVDWIPQAMSIVRKFKAAGSHMGDYPAFSGGLIVANPTYGAPWGAGGPFDPSGAPGSPMPAGDYGNPSNRAAGAVYLGGL